MPLLVLPDLGTTILPEGARDSDTLYNRSYQQLARFGEHDIFSAADNSQPSEQFMTRIFQRAEKYNKKFAAQEAES